MAQEVRRKRGRPRLDDLSKKLNLRAKNGRRIYLGIEGSKRWMEFKSHLGEVSDTWLIGHILDVHDKFCFCRATGVPLKTTLEQGLRKSRTEQGTHTGSHQIGQHMSGPLGEEEMVNYVRNLAKITSASGGGEKPEGSWSTPSETCTTRNAADMLASDYSSNPSEQGYSWKFVHFPTSWKFGDRLAIDLTFHHTPSMNLMAQGMTRTLALHPPDKGPDTERQLSISNFLELYFTAKMMERLGVLIRYSGGCVSANLYIILQKWMYSFFGITANSAEVKQKAEKVIQHFQHLESKYNKNLNEENFECLGDFLLSSWSCFWLQESTEKSSQSTWTRTDAINSSQSQQPSWVASEGPSRNELDFTVYINNGEDMVMMETDATDHMRQEAKKQTSKEPLEHVEIKQEPVEDDVSEDDDDVEEHHLTADSSRNQFQKGDFQGGPRSVSLESDLTATHCSKAIRSDSSDICHLSGSCEGHPIPTEKSDEGMDRHCDASQMQGRDQLSGLSEIHRSNQALSRSTPLNQSQSSFAKEDASGPQKACTKRSRCGEDKFPGQEDQDSDGEPTPSKQANIT